MANIGISRFLIIVKVARTDFHTTVTALCKAVCPKLNIRGFSPIFPHPILNIRKCPHGGMANGRFGPGHGVE